jgi:predicted  nucleic acid-binding Zn-ribbon protein
MADPQPLIIPITPSWLGAVTPSTAFSGLTQAFGAITESIDNVNTQANTLFESKTQARAKASTWYNALKAEKKQGDEAIEDTNKRIDTFQKTVQDTLDILSALEALLKTLQGYNLSIEGVLSTFDSGLNFIGGLLPGDTEQIREIVANFDDQLKVAMELVEENFKTFAFLPEMNQVMNTVMQQAPVLAEVPNLAEAFLKELPRLTSTSEAPLQELIAILENPEIAEEAKAFSEEMISRLLEVRTGFTLEEIKGIVLTVVNLPEVIEDTPEFAAAVKLLYDAGNVFREPGYLNKITDYINSFLQVSYDQFNELTEAVQGLVDTDPAALQQVVDNLTSVGSQLDQNNQEFPSEYEGAYDLARGEFEIKMISLPPFRGNIDTLRSKLQTALRDDVDNGPADQPSNFKALSMFFVKTSGISSSVVEWVTNLVMLLGDSPSVGDVVSTALDTPMVTALSEVFRDTINAEQDKIVNVTEIPIIKDLVGIPSELKESITQGLQGQDLLKNFVDPASSLGVLIGLESDEEDEQRKEKVAQQNQVISSFFGYPEKPDVGAKTNEEGFDISKLITDPQGTWANMSNVQDIWKTVTGAIDYVQELLKDLTGVADNAVNSIQTILDNLQAADEQVDNIRETNIQKAKDKIEAARKDVEGIKFEMLVAPPDQGGLRYVRDVIRTSVDINAENVPEIEEGSTIIANMVVLGAKDLEVLNFKLDTLLKQFQKYI